MEFDVIFFCLASFGITNALCFLHIGHWFRWLVCGCWDQDFYWYLEKGVLDKRQSVLGRLVHCHACMGFWVGFGLSMGGFGPFWDANILEWSVAIMDGFLVSAFNFILWVVLRKLGADKL